MKALRGLLMSAFIFLYGFISAQVIPDSLRVDWSRAGYEGNTPDTSFVINVKDFGAYADGVHDDYKAIIKAINSSSSFRVIYFPAGSYLIKSPISVPGNIIFRGEGDATTLLFDLSAPNKQNAFDISSEQTGVFKNIVSGYDKGSTALKLNDAAGFTTGNFAEIREANGSWDVKPADWATYCIGQIVKIKAVNGDKLIIEPALRIDYTKALHPEIRPVTLKTNVGIECLKIVRVDSIINNKHGYNIRFSYARNCWVRGIESSKSQASHIVLASSKNISISGSYFHDAFTYDGRATAGYGITMIQHNSDCKVENCIFKHLRHSMVAKQGANGNVFAYNYSFDPYRSEVPHNAGGDMVLHGHYAFANLFEGNIGQTIMVDATWGPAGPYNTFFRNRTDLYGIILFDKKVNSVKQNIVGNEITNNDSLKGNYHLHANLHFTYDNNVKNIIQPPGTNNLNHKSYYLQDRPYFWNVSSKWPSIGGTNALNSGDIPARERQHSNESKTICLKEPSKALQVTVYADSIQCNGGVSKITVSATGGRKPYEGIGEYYKPAGNYKFVVSDAFGYRKSTKISLGQPAPLKVSIEKVNVSCKNGNDGKITIKASGGIKPYLYSLDSVNYTSDNVFINLSSGEYTCWVKDASACTAFSNTTIRNDTIACPFTDLKISVSSNPSAQEFARRIKIQNEAQYSLLSLMYVEEKKYSGNRLPEQTYTAHAVPIVSSIATQK